MDKMLNILKKNGRISLEELAGILGVTAEEAADRLDSYLANGVIRGFTAVTDWEKTDAKYVTAFIDLKVTPMKNFGFDTIAREIASFDEVESVYLMSGGYDLGLIIHASNFRDIALFVYDRIAPLEGVVSTATHFVLRCYKESGISFLDDERDERSEFLQ
ncbi:MAG: Lrp/AsnC family transcriptional regulator [Clostridia bacterium]|nr:Lrp/AsnC family transcriptional regulator [Clostridia bacterium]MBR0303717.1 Lrp/AsnC family transcriptional regulator [Clostridia bacterium]